MRILVEPSDYMLRNRGDVASLRVALDRLRTLWPDATITVLTDDAEQCRALAPSIAMMSTAGHALWNDTPLASRLVPRRVARVLGSYPAFLDAAARMQWPQATARRLRRDFRHAPATLADLDAYLAAVADADLVVVTGMGGITDEFRHYALGVLGTLALANHYAIPTAMMSQQIGPIASRRLERVARRVLPTVDMVTLREGRTGLPLLRRLGVDEGRVRTTGDDTIGLVVGMRGSNPGTGIGLNVRTSRYARVTVDDARLVGRIVGAASKALDAPLVGLPISQYEDEDDVRTIEGMTRRTDPEPYPPVTDLRGFVDLVQRCRVVVTGSYHGAVFALAQGIPAVCLASSPYYDQKFLGLQALFGEGCEVVPLDGSLDANLRDAIQRTWAAAPDLETCLLAAATRQVELGRAAYGELGALVARPRPTGRKSSRAMGTQTT